MMPVNVYLHVERTYLPELFVASAIQAKSFLVYLLWQLLGLQRHGSNLLLPSHAVKWHNCCWLCLSPKSRPLRHFLLWMLPLQFLLPQLLLLFCKALLF
jgi:hypothetical protein